MLLRAWPEIHRRTGARLRVVGRRPARRCGSCSRATASPTTGSTSSASSSQDDLTAELLSREGARRAVARRRELRHGARRARSRARRRSSRPTSTATAAVMTPETGSARAARRPGGARGRGRRLLADEPRRQALGARRAADRAGALLLGRDRARGCSRSTRASPARRGSRSRRRVSSRLAHSRLAAHGRRPRRSRRSSVALLWLRGPDWHVVGDAFQAVRWEWVAGGDRAQPALGRRALVRVAHGDRRRRCRRRTRRLRSSSRPSASACSGTRCCPAGSASSRGSRCSRAGCRGGQGLWATLVGTVFAHRAVRPRARRSCLVVCGARRRRRSRAGRPGA